MKVNDAFEKVADAASSHIGGVDHSYYPHKCGDPTIQAVAMRVDGKVMKVTFEKPLNAAAVTISYDTTDR